MSLLSDLRLELPAGYDFTPVELRQIQLAQSQLDDIARLEAELESQQTIVDGHVGQPRLNPIVSELRQQRHEAQRMVEIIRRGMANVGVPVKSGTRYSPAGSRMKI